MLERPLIRRERVHCRGGRLMLGRQPVVDRQHVDAAVAGMVGFTAGVAIGAAVNNNYYRADRIYADPYNPGYKPVGLSEVFTVTNGPSYRLTIDMSDLDGAQIIQTTGQSGNPFDAHYGDLIERWREGKTVPLLFTRAAVEKRVAYRLNLRPAT